MTKGYFFDRCLIHTNAIFSMKQHIFKIKSLLRKFNSHGLSGAEEQELDDWYNSIHYEINLVKEEEFQQEDNFEINKLKLLQKINQKKRSAKVISFSKKFAAAAAVVFLVISAIFWIHFSSEKQSLTVEKKIPTLELKDITAGTHGAILSLANGEVIELDTIPFGNITTQGGVIIRNENGKLSYLSDEKSSKEIVYNTLTTPPGKEYSLVLPDGSKVWLNAQSSISFPTVFDEKERQVTLSGEAYFEVAKVQGVKGRKPFKIKINSVIGNKQEVEIEVLGTSFNVNAYDDEPVIQTTLLEGRVRVYNDRKSVELTPLQQSVILNNGKNQILSDINVDRILSWKNGLFHFEKTDIHTILRQFSRWYNVDMVSEELNSHRSFSGKISRESKLEDVLKILDLSSIHYSTDGKQLIINDNIQ